VLLIVVLLTIGAIGALIVSGSGSLGEEDTTPTAVVGADGQMVIVSQSDPSASPASDGAAPSDAESPASEPTPSDAPDDGSPAGPTVPPATSTPAGPTNVELARQWAENWQAGDFAGMYALLSEEARGEIDEPDFAERYRAIYERATITGVAVEVSDADVLTDASAVPFTATFTSTTLGEFSQDNELPLIRTNGVWSVDWSPSAIFDELGDGCIDTSQSPTSRGRILDRNGEVLAQDQLVVDIGVNPGAIEDEAAVNAALADALGMDADEIADAYADADPTWFVNLRTMPLRDAQAIIAHINLPGVQVIQSTGRVYPYGAAAAHITGFVTEVSEEDIARDPTLATGSWLGRAGLEAGADGELGGQPGISLNIVECEGRGVRETITQSPPVPGRDIILTIDIGFQQLVDETLSRIEGDDERASAVILDPRNGAVLALASHPTYDPNGFVLGFTSEEQARISDAELTPLISRATSGEYPVGSIFKVITMAAGMRYLDMDSSTVVDCPATYEINGQIYRDWVVEWGELPQGQLTLHDALVQSCNTVFYDIGAKVDQQDDMYLPDMARSFGLGAPTDIPYLPENAGVVPDAAYKEEAFGDGWSTGDAINLAIGQGFLLATPLQMANVYAAIANGGTLLEPFIVEYTQEPNGPATRVGQRTERGEIPLEAGQLEQIEQALRDQTSNAEDRGSSRVFGASYPFAIAGKTGTSEDASDPNNVPHSWFAAYGPWENGQSEPTIASVVMIENIGEGGKFAAPATKEIYDGYIQTDLADVTGRDDGEPPLPQSVRPAPSREPVAPPSGAPSAQPSASVRGRWRHASRHHPRHP
jgi:penicillin-binding protein 2